MGVKFGELTLFEHLVKQGLAKRLLTVSTYLDGFSLVNHGQFAKFAELSSHQTFQLYGNRKMCKSIICSYKTVCSNN